MVTQGSGALPLKLVSVNVCTLRPREECEDRVPSVRRVWIADQLASACADLVGIQEGRSPPGFRKVAPYLMVASQHQRSAAGAAVGGCELWLHSRLRIEQDDLAVLVTSSRALLVRLPLAGHAALALVAHGLSSPASDEEKTSWWTDLRAQVRRHLRPGEPLLLFADANGRLGSVQSEAVGPVDADEGRWGRCAARPRRGVRLGAARHP